MTVSYQYDVASSTSGGFTRLLFKWKGSLYKLVYKELVLFVICYTVMSIIYRHVFTDEQKRSFERLALYCDAFMNYIPLSFILGFYVTFVASRWWQQYMAIPWPDKLLHAIALHVTGYDEKGRMMRRTMVRYLNLSFVLVLRSISSAVKRRFPTFDHIVEAGFMTNTELQIYKTVPSTEFNTYWVPFTWFTALVKEARYQKRIADPHGVKLIMEEFNDFRQMCGMLWSYDWVSIPLVYTQMFLEFRSKCSLLWCYDWVSIPLVYTQVVTIATYAFFFACIIGRQFVEKSPVPYKVKPDLYIPYFTLLQFFFYMGLLKVAEQLINPFGDDDEDFELNWIIDRHMKVSYLIVDTLLLKTPPLTKDMYFNQESPVLPYTEAAVPFKKKAYRGSVAHMTIPEDQQTFILPDIEEETDEENTESADSFAKAMIVGGLFSSTTGMFRTDTTGTANGDPRDFVAVNSASKTSGKRVCRPGMSAGSKGAVSSAVLAVGTNQVLLAAGADSLSQVRGENDVDYVVLPMDSVYFDGKDSSQYGSDTKVPPLTSKSSFKLPASIKSRIAMRKKPVMKWKPYQKPPSNENSEECVDEPLPYGCYEEECAFMWRTIEDDAESCKQLSVTSGSAREGAESDRYFIEHHDHRLLSSYIGTVPQCSPKTKLSYSSAIKSSLSLTPSSSVVRAIRRYQYRPKSKMAGHLARRHGSLPQLRCSSCGHQTIYPQLVRSLSENSIFLDAVISRLRSHSKTSNSLSYSNSQPATPRGQQTRRKSCNVKTIYHTSELQ